MKFSSDFISASKEYSTFHKFIPAPYFRREFEMSIPECAEVTICGLGFYELFVNGERITKGRLSPYISNPDHILYYDNYDLIPYLREGKNVIGILLGNGNLNAVGGRAWELDIARFRSAPKFALAFEAAYKDGSKTEFTARDSFKWAESPILFDDMRIGEFYDARCEKDGWCQVGYDDSDWLDPIDAETPRGDCRLCDALPILPIREVSPISIKPNMGISAKDDYHNPIIFSMFTDEEYFHIPEDENPEGGYLYDFGINSAGVIRLNIKNAKPGQKICMQFAEKICDDGGLDLRDLRMYPPRFNEKIIYTCKGGDEVYTPEFCYFGFRYVLIKGITEEQATPELLTYVVMNTALKSVGGFSCSDEVTNKIWEAGANSNTANFYHYPTDCPHRERLGWTNDSSSSAEHILLTLDAEVNYREWMRNIRKAMTEEGAIPGIIPTTVWGYDRHSGPIFDRVIVYIPYYVWLYRGDIEILRENATAIFRNLNSIANNRSEFGMANKGYGDWMPAGRDGTQMYLVDREFVITAVSIDMCKKAAKIFEVLGMDVQKNFAMNLYNELRAAARNHINKATMTVKSRCQTGQAIAIAYDIFDEAEKPKAFEQLVKIVEADREFITCGMIGLRVIFNVLAEYGRCDLAYKMITRPEFPSYGNWIKNGATTLWEGFLPAEGKQFSQNHHFHGHIMAWFVKHLVGININPFEKSEKDVLFAPKFIDALDHAEAFHDTALGRVSAKWFRDGEDIVYTLSIPEGMNGEMEIELGWKFDDGLAWKRLNSGEATFRIIRDNKKDRITLSSTR